MKVTNQIKINNYVKNSCINYKKNQFRIYLNELKKEVEKKYWFYVYNCDYVNEQKQLKKLDYLETKIKNL
jgi:hypothetical protein